MNLLITGSFFIALLINFGVVVQEQIGQHFQWAHISSWQR